MRPYLLIGGTRYFGAVRTVDETARSYLAVWNQNPATSADWLQADVEGAIEGGWEAVA